MFIKRSEYDKIVKELHDHRLLAQFRQEQYILSWKCIEQQLIEITELRAELKKFKKE